MISVPLAIFCSCPVIINFGQIPCVLKNSALAIVIKSVEGDDELFVSGVKGKSKIHIFPAH